MEQATFTTQDQEHLRLLSIFHFVVATLAALMALFPILHLILGLAMMIGAFEGSSNNPPPAFIGIFFVAFAAVWIVIGLAFAICLIMAGKYLRSRSHYTFCLVVAGLSCMFMPFGTVLGVFTIIVLMRESVRSAFGVTPPRAASQ